MTLTEYLLSKMTEEGAEVIQRATKAQTFGLDEVQAGQALDNRQRLTDEVTDFMAVVDMLTERGILNPIDPAAKDAKREKVMQYMAYSVTQGTLQLSDDDAGDLNVARLRARWQKLALSSDPEELREADDIARQLEALEGGDV